MLTLAPGANGRTRGRDRAVAAFRAGCFVHSTRGEARGDVPALLAPVIERLVRDAPIETLLEGRLSLGSIFGG